MVIDNDERERRREAIIAARETLARVAEVAEPDDLAAIMARRLPDPLTVWREEAAAKEARFEAERRRKAEDALAAETREALEACARAIDAMDRENAALREQVTKLAKRIEALERAPVDTLTGIDRGLARIDKLADKLSQTLQHTSKRRFDSAPLPLPPLN